VSGAPEPSSLLLLLAGLPLLWLRKRIKRSVPGLATPSSGAPEWSQSNKWLSMASPWLSLP
ncbi:MAG: PEP-CTERM sorting domain-containing protein, partial [Bryobacteraceae bacterium]